MYRGAIVFLLSARSGAEVQDGHAYSDSVGDLLEDERAAGIRDLRVDLGSSVDRAGVHDQGVWFQSLESTLIESEQGPVFADGRKVGRGLSFVLDS